MTSSVYFKMHHGDDVLPVNFTGHQIRLLDLKRSIMELKNLNKGLDFDLRITDSDSQQGSFLSSFSLLIFSFFFSFVSFCFCHFSLLVYNGDETFVPKNTTVVVKRIPVPSGTGLLRTNLTGSRGHLA